MELNKAFSQVKIEVIAILGLVVLEAIFQTLLSLFPFKLAVGCGTGILFLVIGIGLYLYMGLKLVKFDVLEVFLVGGITGILATFLRWILNFVLLRGGSLFGDIAGFVSSFVLGGVLVLIGYAIKKYVLK